MWETTTRRPSALATAVLLLAWLGAPGASAADYATNEAPLAFGPDQTIIDLNKITWEPLELEGFAPGAEIAVLRGDLAHGSESVVRVPAGYIIPAHYVARHIMGLMCPTPICDFRTKVGGFRRSFGVRVFLLAT